MIGPAIIPFLGAALMLAVVAVRIGRRRRARMRR